MSDIIGDQRDDNIRKTTVNVDTENLSRYRPNPGSIPQMSPNPDYVPEGSMSPNPDYVPPEQQNIPNEVNPNATVDPNLAELGDNPIIPPVPGESPVAQPQVEDVLGFNQVTQPNLNPPDMTVPEMRARQQADMDVPFFVPPQFDPNSLLSTADTLYGGNIRQYQDEITRRILPDIQPDNTIAERFLPRRTIQPRRSRVERGLSWLGRILNPSETRGNNLVDRGISLLLNGLNPFSPFFNAQMRGDDFGEYGTGALGLLFYGLDFIPNTFRGALLDLLANGTAVVQTARDRGGINIANPEWRRAFGELRNLYDAVPDGDQYESYLTRALLGDDLSPFNFQESLDGTINPLGVLGESSSDFYAEVDAYSQAMDVVQSMAPDSTNWFQRLMLSPTVRMMPRATGAFLLDVATDPLAGPIVDGIRAVGRRFINRGVQTTPPPRGLLPPAAERGLPVPDPPTTPPAAPIQPYVRTNRGTRQLPPGFESPSSNRVSVDVSEFDLNLANELRQRIRNGMSVDEAVNEVANLISDPDVAENFRRINQPQWNAPRNVIVTEPPQHQWGDIARSPRRNPGDFPVRRSPAERTRIINSQTNILPDGLDNSQINRVIDSMPPRVADELDLAARPMGRVVDDLTPASRSDVPDFLLNVGDEAELIDNVVFTRTAQNTIQIRRVGVVNYDEFIPTIRSLVRDYPARYEFMLPEDKLARPYAVRMMEDLGFRESGTRMVYTPPRRTITDEVLPFSRRSRRPNLTVVDRVANNTGRPRGAYTDSVVQIYDGVRNQTPLSDLPINSADQDRLYRESFPFGRVNRVSERSYTIEIDDANSLDRFGEYVPLTRQQRVSLRQAIRTAPENAIISVDTPRYLGTVLDLMQEGFIVRNAETNALTTADTLINNATAVDEWGGLLYDIVYRRGRQQVSNIRNVRELPTTRGVEETGETLEELAQRADDITPATVDEVTEPAPLPDVPEAQLSDVPEVEFTAAGEPILFRQGDRGFEFYRASDQNLVDQDLAHTLSFQGRNGDFATLEDAQNYVRDNIDTISERVAQSQDESGVAQGLQELLNPEASERLNLEQEAIRDLLQPDLTRNPEAYDEVRDTLPDALAPYSPTAEELAIVQRYTEQQSLTESLMIEHSDMLYQLDQIRQIDAEAFYDELLLAGDELSTFNIDEAQSFLREDDMYDVLVELYNDMIEEPTTRNVQRYLSQLEHTTDEQLADISRELYSAMDDLFTQEDLLRSTTNSSNQRYIQDVLDSGDLNRRQLDAEFGKSSRGNCD